jgi:hypothetical protein
MKHKFFLFLSFLFICQLSNAFGAAVMKFENRWPFVPAKSIAVSDDYVFQAYGNVILVIDKDDFTNAAPVKRIYQYQISGTISSCYDRTSWSEQNQCFAGNNYRPLHRNAGTDSGMDAIGN